MIAVLIERVGLGRDNRTTLSFIAMEERRVVRQRISLPCICSNIARECHSRDTKT
jgi:hypothetical protein